MNFTKTILEAIKYWIENKFSKIEKELTNKQPIGDYALKEDIPVTSVNGQIGDVVIDIPESSNGSWNDLTDRPFGIEYSIILSDTQMNSGLNDVRLSDGFIEGEKYVVTYNNIEYLCIAKYIRIDEDYYYSLKSFDNSPIPVSLEGFDGLSGKAYCQFDGILSIKKPIIKQLDEQFIPDTIARVADIESDLANKQPIGDYVLKDDIPVTSVNGKVGSVVIDTFSGSWNDLTDKPFYEYKADIIVPETAVSKETPFTGKPLVYGNEYTVTIDGTQYQVETIGITNGKRKLEIKHNGKKIEIYYNPDNSLYTIECIQDFEAVLSIKYGKDELATLDEKFIPDTIARTEDIEKELNKKQPVGDYALKDDIPVTSVNGMTGDVVIDISEQIQPNWDQNNSATLDYIKNRPFYTEDPTKVVVVEEETLTVGSDLYVECQFFPFEIGNTYFVTFNGTEYECVAWSDPNYEAGKTVCVGNGTFLGSDGYGDDLPFVIESYPVWGRATYLNVGETGDYILSVSETQSIVHQIDIKYVPHDDTKMDVENPVCTGTFSMNRQKDSPIGSSSFVEGSGGSASGICSHAEGLATIATGNYSHAQGLYNIEDTENKYAHIVGNGGGHLGVYTRSNAHTLDWNGVGWFQGGLQVGGSAQDDGAKSVMLNGDKEIILASSTFGSTKQFKLTIDDEGVITATEIVESAT
jgi:hypothetical protein